MKAFLKENIVLLAGISLPLLLTFVFFAATQVGKATITPPSHSLIFATNYRHHNSTNHPYSIVVKNKQVRFAYHPPEDKERLYRWQKPHLFVFDPVQGTSREIELPAIDDPSIKIDTPIKELSSHKVSTLEESPDGFTFGYDYRGSFNLMTEMFGGGSRSRSRHVISKGTYKKSVPKSQRYNSEFIGWIVEE